MATFKRKNVIKSYKLRLQEKLKTVTEETENTTSFLNSCVEKFGKRVQHILEIKDEKCLSLYRQLNKDLEDFSEKLFILQGSFEEDDSDSSEDNAATDAKLQETTPKSLFNQSSQNENFSSISSLKYVNTKKNEAIDLQSQQDITNVQLYSKENETLHRFSEKKLYEQKHPESSITKSSSINEDGGNLSEDDFHSLNSDNNVNNTNSCTLSSSNLHNVSEKECTSSISFSHSSYRSVSSTISEPLPVHKDTTSNQSVETPIVEDNECSLNSKESCLINPPNFEIQSCFSGTLSCIIDPGNFWIVIENPHVYKLNFPKSEYTQLNGLSSIKMSTYCLAPFKSKSTPFYYRALSLSDGKCGKDFVKVIFIDRGSTEEVLVCNLRPLPAFAYEIPAQAIHCYLYGIKPIGDSWSHESTERFEEFQSFCIEAVVKSKETLYGVHLVGKFPARVDEADLDVDIADALCVDNLAEPINESQLHDENQLFESQVSKLCNKINLSLNVLDSYDMNAISNDSGVSVTSICKSNQVSTERNEFFQKVSENDVSSVTSEPDKTILLWQNAMEVKDLISFETDENLCNPQSSNAILKSIHNSFSSHCNKNFSLHLEVLSPSLLFVEKDMVIVMVSHIVNPHEFYVNMAMKSIENFDELREQMNITYNSEKNIPKVEINDLAEGMFCAGLFNDDYWYRIKILRISSEDKEKNQVLAQYIDYGNISVIQCCHIRPLTSEFSKYPTFAIKCALAGIKPIIYSASNNDSYWNEDAINTFKKLTPFEQRCLTAQIYNDNTQNDTYSVFLWDVKDSGDLLINAALAEHKVAKFDYTLSPVLTSANQEIKESKPDSIDLWDPMSEEYHHTDNNYDVDDEDIEIMTTGYQSKDLQYICKYFAMRGHCPRGSNCDLQHIPLLDVTRDQEGVYCLDTIPIAENVKDVIVQVSTIYTPSHFYVVLPYGGKSSDELDMLALKGPSESTIMYSEMNALFSAMDKHYSKAPFKENTTVALSCGTIVAAKRKQDGKWHRGRIVDVVDTIKPSKVFFVDFGDYEWVSRRSIRTILPQYLHTPFQAVQCNLHGIEPFESENAVPWTTRAVGYFKDIVSGQVLHAKIAHRFGKVFHMSLRKTSQNDHSDIAKLLVSAGYAQYLKVTHSNEKKVLYVPG